MSILRGLLPTSLVLSAIACSPTVVVDDNASSSSGVGGATSSSTTGTGGGTFPISPVDWGNTKCPDRFVNTCATLDVPLDWSDPGGKKIELFAARAAYGDANAPMIWFLQGGPGDSADVFSSFYPFIRASLPNVDFYTFEHRGVGGSTRLACPDQESASSDGGVAITMDEWPACIASLKAQWGDGLAQFNTSNAARDLGYLIAATRASGQKVFVYGGSYGTLWAQRFLQLFPGVVDGVILDSIVSPGVELLSDYDAQFEPVGEQLIAICAADASCSSHLGSDPKAFMTSVLDGLDGGKCAAAGLDRDQAKALISSFLGVWEFRPFIFGLLYRLNRCEAADVTAIKNFSANFFGVPASVGPESDALFYNVGLSEIWGDPPPTVAEAEALDAASLFAPGGAGDDERIWAIWLRYPHDQYVNHFATTSTPMLMMNGDLDPRTPLAKAIVSKSHYAGANQTFVTVEHGDHGLIDNSPLVDGRNAAVPLLAGFVAAPSSPIDLSVLAELAPISFDADPNVDAAIWGQPSMWDNPVANLRPAPPPADSALGRKLRSLRRRHRRAAIDGRQ